MSEKRSMSQDEFETSADGEVGNSATEARAPIVFRVYNGDTYTMSDELISRLEVEFVGIDVYTSLQQMVGWLSNKPSARPMGPVVEKFAREWLTRTAAWKPARALHAATS